MQYLTNTMGKMMDSLIKAKLKDPKTMIIACNEEGYSFNDNIDLSELSMFSNDKDYSYTVSNIHYTLSTKPIPY